MGDRTEQTGWERTTVLKAEKQKYLFLIFKKQAFYRIIGVAGCISNFLGGSGGVGWEGV
jgi:hypothetical protein